MATEARRQLNLRQGSLDNAARLLLPLFTIHSKVLHGHEYHSRRDSPSRD